MKNSILFVLSLFAVNFAFSQNIGINATGATPDASAILDVSSTTKGMLIPRMTTADRTAITSPATGLVVYDTNLNSFYYYNGTSWQWLLNSASGWNTTGNASTVAGTNFIGTTDAIDFVTKTNNTERMRVTSGGNVGIGTSAPNAALQFGNVISNRRIVLWEVANNDHEFTGLGINFGMLRYQVGNNTSDHAFYASTSSTTSNELMRIKGNGNVGIGTNAPVQKLNVVGDILLGTIAGTDGEHNDLEFSPDGGGAGAQLDYYNGALYFSNLNGTSNTLTIKDNADVGIGTAFPIAKLEVTGKIYSTGANAECSAQDRTNGTQYTMYGTGGYMRFWRADYGDVMSMSSLGNVSIGGFTNAAKLEVVGQVKITGGTPGAGKVLISDATGLASWATPGTATGGWGILGNASTVAGTNFIGTTDAVDFVTKTNNTEVMRVTSAGNVGIGTNAPSYKLDISGSQNNLRLQAAAANDYPRMFFSSSHASVGGVINRDAAKDIYFGESSDAGRWIFRGTGALTVEGSVGIGTTAPVNMLQVNSATNTSMVQTSNANTGATATDGAVFGLFNSNAYLYNRENADLYFGTNNTRRMTITAGGNVGIGTAVITPAVPLAVGGVGANVYSTDIWSENNIHVQGNETMLPGGRARLRVGNAWNYAGIYSDLTSTGATNDLVLGASSTWVRIGPNGGGQNLYISNGQLLLGADNAQKPSTSTWIITSDERLKTINGSYSKGLADIIKLNTITYKYKNVGEKKFDEKVLATTQVGFSAQEVQKIFPEAVGVGEDGYLNLNMHAILVAYTNAIKELDAKNKEQEKINNELKQRLEKLEALLEQTK